MRKRNTRVQGVATRELLKFEFQRMQESKAVAHEMGKQEKKRDEKGKEERDRTLPSIFNCVR